MEYQCLVFTVRRLAVGTQKDVGVAQELEDDEVAAGECQIRGDSYIYILLKIC